MMPNELCNALGILSSFGHLQRLFLDKVGRRDVLPVRVLYARIGFSDNNEIVNVVKAQCLSPVLERPVEPIANENPD